MIKTHKELAEHVAGRGVLHLNSLGKDSVLCLEWLTRAARPSHVVSINYRLMSGHPLDDLYLAYLKKRYPDVTFITGIDTTELNWICDGTYQSPLAVNHVINDFEYDEFSRGKLNSEIKAKYNCDFICLGHSKYESFSRATGFYQRGLVQEDRIYPLGLMTKEQIYGVMKASGVRLHPLYRLNKSTFDHPTYWKMRASFLAYPEYKKKVFSVFPLLKLDQYRYEVLFREKEKNNKKA